MRKSLLIFTAMLIFIFSFIPQLALADDSVGTVNISVGSGSVNVGDIITVPISFGNVPSKGIEACDFKLSYNSSVLDVVYVSPGATIVSPDTDFTYSIDDGKIYFLFFDDTLTKNSIVSDGVFATIQFKAKTPSTTALSIDSSLSVGDSEMNDLNTNTTPGSIIVKPLENAVSPSETTYDIVKLPELIVTYNSASTIKGIKNGDTYLLGGIDYIVSGQYVSFAKGYMNYFFTKFTKQDLKLTFEFNSGNTAVLTIKPVSPNFATLLPNEIKINKSSLADVTTTVYLNGNTLLDIMNGASSLINGTDFVISGNKVTIKKGYQTYYFSKFPEQNLNIIFRFSNGYDSILSIYPGVSPHSSITPSSIDYKVDSKNDVAVKAALNGNYFSSIKNGTSELVPRVDYTYSVTDNTLIIRRSYLSYYFSKFKKTLVLQINFTGGNPQTLSIVPEYPIS